MRLEEDEHAARLQLARRGERGRDLRGVVRVVVVHAHAVAAAKLEAAAGSRELPQRLFRARTVDAGELERGERSGGVAPVVLARQLQARTSTGSSSSPRTTFGTCGSHASKSARTSASEPNVAW